MPRQLTPFKICTWCKLLKPREEYSRRTTGLYASRCKVCSNTLQKQKYAASESMRTKHREVATKWQKDNAQKHKESASNWEKNNRPSRVAAMHRYRTRKTGNGGQYTVPEWELLKQKYNNACLCCGDAVAKLTADHIVPVALGGTSNIENIQPLCKSCNSTKGTKVIDFRISRGV